MGLLASVNSKPVLAAAQVLVGSSMPDISMKLADKREIPWVGGCGMGLITSP